MNLDELKRLAEAATPGPWKVGTDGWPIGSFSTGNSNENGEDYHVSTYGLRCDELGSGDAKTDATFIAAANPATILDLVEKLKACEEALEIVGHRSGSMHEFRNTARAALEKLRK